MTSKAAKTTLPVESSYGNVLADIAGLIAAARHAAARSVNCVMSATYWLTGRRIVEFEQGGETRAQYGEELLKRLSSDLSSRFGRGFGVDNLQRFRAFYLAYREFEIYKTVSRKGGWPVRQLDRQINSQFYERTALSKNKAAMLAKDQKTVPEDRISPEEEIKDSARFDWNEVTEVLHYYLSVDALTKLMQVREESPTYGGERL